MLNGGWCTSRYYSDIENSRRSWTGVPQEHQKMSPPNGEHAGEIPQRRGTTRAIIGQKKWSAIQIMDIVYRRCAGLDVHKKTVVCCRLILDETGQPVKDIRTFGAMTADLLALGDWLRAGQVTHVAMESTGVYWKPVFNLLEGIAELLLINAKHIKFVPGHKTDVKDAQWIAELLQHGLLKASFIPPTPQRDLRELVRYRIHLIDETGTRSESGA